jgi:hypothetical protein
VIYLLSRRHPVTHENVNDVDEAPDAPKKEKEVAA